MGAKKSPKATMGSVQDAPSHSRDLLLALSRVAQSFQRARTADEFYHVLGNEIKSLGGMVTLLTVNEDRSLLTVAYTSYESKLLRNIEKTMGMSATGYSFAVSSNTLYSRRLASGNAEFVHWTEEHIADALPTPIRPMIGKLMKVFNITEGILAPLRVDNETLGLIMISGLFLNEDDVSVIDSFAGQTAAGLQNIRLMQKLQDELVVRGQVEEALNHNRNLVLALSRAAQSIQRVHTAEEIYRVVGDQIKSLGGEVTLLMLDEARQSLTATYISYDLAILRKIEKLTGSSAIGYRIVFSPDSIYARNIAANKAEYVHSAKEHFYDAFPKGLRRIAEQLIHILKVEQGILAPLHVEGEVLGLMMVSGLGLNEGDVPAMESFAGQIAAGLKNVRLMQKLQDELVVRSHVEESLNHNRDLLLALSRAAQAIQLVREPEDIYRVVGEQIQALGFEATILMFGDDHRRLYYRYTTLPENLIRAAEKIAGVKAQSYNWSISPDSIYDKVIKEGKAEYISSAVDLFAEVLPSFLHAMAGTLIQILKAGHGILAPLHVGEESFGVLIVFGSDTLSKEDLPAIDSFAGQVSVSLRNARLAQQVESELKVRNQAEAALRASEAKIHALMDAIPDMMFMLDHEGKFLDYHATKGRSLYVPPEVFLGKNIRDVMPSLMVEIYIAKFERAVQSGESQLFEYALEQGDKRQFFEAHIVVYQNNQVLCVVRDITQRKEAEETVRQTEKHFKALIENATDGIALVGLNGKTVYASPSARNMFKYTDGEDINDNPVEFVHPDDIRIVLQALNDLIQDPAYVPVIEYRYKHKDDTYHWVESTFSNLLSEPSVQAVVINFRDITERKNIEKALYESEKYYRALIENATDGIFVINADGTIRYESPSVTRMLGYDRDGLIGTSAFDLIHPDDLERVSGAFLQGLNLPGFVHRGEYRLHHHNGEWRYFEIVSHYLIEDSVISGIIVNGRDITERKLAEDALRESERKFHSVISESADGIILSDELGRIIEFNDAIEQITGQSRDTVLGQFLWDFQFQVVPEFMRTDEHYVRVKEAVQKVLETGESLFHNRILESPFQSADGSLGFIQQRLFSIRTEKGWRLGSISRDITQQKQANETLRRQYENLHSLYQMTATLSQSMIIEEVYDAALDSLQNTLSVDRVSILLFDEGGVMRFKAWRGLSDAYRKAAEGHSPWKEDAQDPQPVLVADAMADSSLAALHSLFLEEGIGALGFIPLVHQGRLLGKFMIYFNTTHNFSTEEIQLAETIARHVALAIFRKRADEALRTSEERYRILYEDNPSMYFTADTNGTILSVNKFVFEQLGFSKEELTGQSVLSVFHPNDREYVRQKFVACLQQPDQAIQIEAQKVRKDGTVLWVRESARAVHNLSGQMVVLLICDDITERKQAQEALAASLAEMHALFASMQDAVLVIDRDGTYQKVAPTNSNKRYLQPEDVVGKKLTDFFPADVVKRFLGVIQQVLETQKTVQVEYKLEVKGQSPWFESSVSPMDANSTIWVARDISERKQVEAKLHLQSAALEAAANTILITDHKGIIQWANSSFGSLTGFDPKEAIGKNPGLLTKSGKHDREFYKDLWDTILSGKIWHNELINRRKDGSLYFEEMTITPLRNFEGEISHFIAVKQDITERKQVEEALIKSEQQYRTLFENMPIGLYRTSADGRILDANIALINMFAYPDRSTLLAMRAEDLYADPELNNKFKSVISEKGMLSAFESEFRRYDQQTFWAEDYVHVIRDEAGNPLYFEGSLINITDRRKAEDDLRQANQSLQLAHSELQQMFLHEQVLARTDSLTGQTNRRYFFEIAMREFDVSIRYHRPLTIILFDIDGFKHVNDTFGHAIGDTLLIQVAQATATQVRSVDVLARYGGDEFIILLPETNAEQAFLIAERVRESVAITRMETENSPFVVTLSVGVAEIVYEPYDMSIEDVIRRADEALYKAKKNGRNHTVIYTKF